MRGEIDKYKTLILQAIGQHWILPEEVDKTLSCKLLIRLAPDGTLLDARIVESSGNSVLDRSALNAVQKASPLPIPDKAEIFDKFREFNLTVRPESLLSTG